MARCAAVWVVILVGAVGTARANGRAEATSTINFRQGHEQDIAAGMTFGLVLSHDGGATWSWMCEKAVKYGGNYDPDYGFAQSGALFATTFDGTLVMRDGCSFDATQFAHEPFSTLTIGPDHALYLAAVGVADGTLTADAKIYRSTDDGVTFPVAAIAGQNNDWYKSIEVAPTDPSRVYLTGYRDGPTGRSWQIYRSDDRGVQFTLLPETAFTTTPNSAFDIVGIERGAADTVYVRVDQQTDTGDAVWKSIDAGQSWTKIFEQADRLAFVVRANGDLVAASRTLGTWVSHDRGGSWIPVTGAPHIDCLVENGAGELWACTQNNDKITVPVPSDGAGIMKTTDLASWTKVLRFRDIRGPVDCPVGTRQREQCVYNCTDAAFDANPAACSESDPKSWCALTRQLGITSEIIACPSTLPELPPAPRADTGCCDAGTGAPTALLAGLVVAGLVQAKRRRRGAGLARG